jgi:hypothetical protein
MAQGGPCVMSIKRRAISTLTCIEWQRVCGMSSRVPIGRRYCRYLCIGSTGQARAKARRLVVLDVPSISTGEGVSVMRSNLFDAVAVGVVTPDEGRLSRGSAIGLGWGSNESPTNRPTHSELCAIAAAGAAGARFLKLQNSPILAEQTAICSGTHGANGGGNSSRPRIVGNGNSRRCPSFPTPPRERERYSLPGIHLYWIQPRDAKRAGQKQRPAFPALREDSERDSEKVKTHLLTSITRNQYQR